MQTVCNARKRNYIELSAGRGHNPGLCARLLFDELNNHYTVMTGIIEKFAIEGAVESVKPLGEGFINDTFIVTTANGGPRYILQRKNKNIFTDIPAMMNNINNVTNFLKAKVKAAGGDAVREVMTVIPTLDGALCHVDEQGDFWAVSLFIEDSVTYEAAPTPELAYQGGKGIGKFQSMLSDYEGRLADILPGFHNMRFRFEQWDDVLRRDPAGRKAALAEEIGWIESRREEMLAFWSKVETGEIPTRITHNDTKINNILFDKQGEVLCVIDLDTVLSSTCLNDFGDAIRTYANHGKEDDADLSNVWLDLAMFRGYTQGYLSQTRGFLTAAERDNLAFSAKYITFEQVLRFLMDYIDGDHYYKIKSPDHNLVRTRAQYALLESMEANYAKMCDIVAAELKK